MPLGRLVFSLLFHSSADTSDVQCQFFCLELTLVDFEILDFIFILFELFVGFGLIVQVGKYFVIDSEFERLSLLDDIEGVTIESEGILEGSVGGELIFEEYFAVNSDFDFSGDE